jgi:hypothetical protein
MKEHERAHSMAMSLTQELVEEVRSSVCRKFTPQVVALSFRANDPPTQRKMFSRTALPPFLEELCEEHQVLKRVHKSIKI